MTVQIGDATALARAIHIPVMYDFRAADVEAGGQGAPFVPVYHRALAQSLEREGPIVVVNIGGVSNITYIDGTDVLIACDTGPGNALLDDYMFRKMSQPFDCEGRLAAQGAVDVPWVIRALEHPFFALPPPKSLDRNDFASLVLREMPPADGAATLTAFTAEAHRPHRAAAAEGAEELDRRRRRRPQPHHAADAARASRACDRGIRRRAGLVGRRHRGAGVRLSGRARPERSAAKLSRHYGCADPDDRRGDRAAVNGVHLRVVSLARQPVMSPLIAPIVISLLVIVARLGAVLDQFLDAVFSNLLTCVFKKSVGSRPKIVTG